MGYKCPNLSITGDIDGAIILKKCTFKSQDFTHLNIPGTYLYMSGHAGSFVGEHVVNGKSYNVIECTGAWDKKVLRSWVDTDGTRRRYKGGRASGKWTDYGLMCWIDYGNEKPAENDISYVYKGVDYSPVFDPGFYKRNADVVKVYGDKPEQLFKHFTDWGMKEGRKGNAVFDPYAYMRASKNVDLRLAYGHNMSLYYEHYCRYGKNEGRALK